MIHNLNCWANVSKKKKNLEKRKKALIYAKCDNLKGKYHHNNEGNHCHSLFTL